MSGRKKVLSHILFLFALFAGAQYTYAQQVTARTDANRILVGDQVRMFIEAKKNASATLQWPAIPDTFNTLEVVEKGKIDTTTNGNIIIYKQRLLITGFDSGSYTIPAFSFLYTQGGSQSVVMTDSFQLLVQTVDVDTSRPFKGIKDIVTVETTWRDYLIWIIAGAIFIILVAVIIWYFAKNKKIAVAVAPKKPKETPQQKAFRLLEELDKEQLWQHDKIKDFYSRLTDILRNYIEERFNTPAMELTTDQLLRTAELHREMTQYKELLANTLYIADLAKFARAKPMPQEHVDAMEAVKQFVKATEPKPEANTEQKQ